MLNRAIGTALLLILTACGSGQPDASSTPRDTPTVSATTPVVDSASVVPEPSLASAAASAPLEIDGFEQVAQVSGVGINPAGLVPWGAGFVAMDMTAGVMTSTEGYHWEQVEPSGLEGALIWKLIATTDGRLVAFGSPGALHAPGPSEDFTAWISSDVMSWDVIELGLPRSLVVRDVAVGPRGMVLVGSYVDASVGPTVESLWFSTDGLAWRQTFSVSGDAMLVAAGAGPEGFVAVGQHGWASNQGRGLALASSDGISWLEAESESGPLRETPSLWSIAPVGGDWITVPAPQDSQVKVIHSQNGLAWQIGTPLTLGSHLEGHTAALEWDGRHVFLHVPVAAEADAPPSLWMSTDGEAWQPLGIDVLDGAFVAAGNGQTTVLMITRSGDPPSAEFWASSN